MAEASSGLAAHRFQLLRFHHRVDQGNPPVIDLLTSFFTHLSFEHDVIIYCLVSTGDATIGKTRCIAALAIDPRPESFSGTQSPILISSHLTSSHPPPDLKLLFCCLCIGCFYSHPFAGHRSLTQGRRNTSEGGTHQVFQSVPMGPRTTSKTLLEHLPNRPQRLRSHGFGRLGQNQK
jgi:hypothetical protein